MIGKEALVFPRDARKLDCTRLTALQPFIFTSASGVKFTLEILCLCPRRVDFIDTRDGDGALACRVMSRCGRIRAVLVAVLIGYPLLSGMEQRES